jgi:hypothetical protein
MAADIWLFTHVCYSRPKKLERLRLNLKVAPRDTFRILSSQIINCQPIPVIISLPSWVPICCAKSPLLILPSHSGPTVWADSDLSCLSTTCGRWGDNTRRFIFNVNKWGESFSENRMGIYWHSAFPIFVLGKPNIVYGLHRPLCISTSWLSF